MSIFWNSTFNSLNSLLIEDESMGVQYFFWRLAAASTLKELMDILFYCDLDKMFALKK